MPRRTNRTAGFQPASAALLLALCAIATLPARAAAGEKERPEWVAPPRAAAKANPIPADAKSLALGKKVYAAECLECHATDGKGGGPEAKRLKLNARNFSEARVAEQSDGALFWKISEGNRTMPGWAKLLTEEERWHVLNYIRQFNSNKDKTPADAAQSKKADK